MIQHINLLRSERTQARDAIQLGPVLIGLAVMLSLVGAADWYVRERLTESTRQAKAARADKQTRVTRENAVMVVDEGLLKDLSRQRARLAQLQTVDAQLRDLGSAPPPPFSSLFDALARRSLDGVWLVGLSADGQARALTLTGRATEPERVPLYLKSLNHESLLRDRGFQAMDVREREVLPGTRVVEFRLSTSPLLRSGS